MGSNTKKNRNKGETKDNNNNNKKEKQKEKDKKTPAVTFGVIGFNGGSTSSGGTTPYQKKKKTSSSLTKQESKKEKKRRKKSTLNIFHALTLLLTNARNPRNPIVKRNENDAVSILLSTSPVLSIIRLLLLTVTSGKEIEENMNQFSLLIALLLSLSETESILRNLNVKMKNEKIKQVKRKKNQKNQKVEIPKRRKKILTRPNITK